MKLLDGMTGIVTGGARGLGLEIILAFLREGASVECIDLIDCETAAQVEAVAAENGARVRWHKADVTNEEQISPLIEKILSDCDGIDILVNNAGITRDKLVFRMSLDEWQTVLTVNLT